mmetsp:Transcript_13671/g.34355  ORF Transcript_13671/g.34355 Transcript_13671/m.34355 type:complete len:338 (-) Transcript_13671:2422-3435(-)
MPEAGHGVRRGRLLSRREDRVHLHAPPVLREHGPAAERGRQPGSLPSGRAADALGPPVPPAHHRGIERRVGHRGHCRHEELQGAARLSRRGVSLQEEVLVQVRFPLGRLDPLQGARALARHRVLPRVAQGAVRRADVPRGERKEWEDPEHRGEPGPHQRAAQGSELHQRAQCPGVVGRLGELRLSRALPSAGPQGEGQRQQRRDVRKHQKHREDKKREVHGRKPRGRLAHREAEGVLPRQLQHRLSDKPPRGPLADRQEVSAKRSRLLVSVRVSASLQATGGHHSKQAASRVAQAVPHALGGGHHHGASHEAESGCRSEELGQGPDTTRQKRVLAAD